MGKPVTQSEYTETAGALRTWARVSSAGEAQPQSASVSSSSSRSSSSTRRAPASPPDREAPERRTPDQHGVGAERQGDRDVDAAPDAAVDQHGAAPVDGLDHLGQRVGRGETAVELAAAVV